MLTLDQSLRPHPNAVDTELETNELVLLHLESKQGSSLGNISRHLQEEFEIDPDRADRSVLRIASEPSREKLVQTAD